MKGVSFGITFLFLTLLNRILARQDCEPFAVRLFLGQIFVDPSSSEKVVVMFNTNSECLKSYILMQYDKTSIDKTYCSQKILKLESPAANSSEMVLAYTTTIHKCSVSKIQFAKIFSYNVYGWDGSKTTNPIAYRSLNIQTSIFDPNNVTQRIIQSQQQLKFVSLADWGYLKLKKDIYTPLSQSFDKLLSSKQIDGVIIDGDIGYDLDSNNCQNYQDYLIMGSQVTIYWPSIYTTGNHEYNTNNNYQLYTNSFILYGLDSRLAARLNLGNFYLVPFDPYFYLYPSNIRVSNRADSLTQFKQIISETIRLAKPIIAQSHYPLICSGSSKSCETDAADLKNFFDVFFENRIGLYLGAHCHTYERIYPYYKNMTTQKLESPYLPQQNNYLVSIVQGAAGNDNKIVENYDQIKNFTAAYTVNETGFGVLISKGNQFRYEHYSAKRGMQLVDSMELTLHPSIQLETLELELE